jgi:hypothetical protein
MSNLQVKPTVSPSLAIAKCLDDVKTTLFPHRFTATRKSGRTKAINLRLL